MAGLASVSRRTFHAKAWDARSPDAPVAQRTRRTRLAFRGTAAGDQERGCGDRNEGVNEADENGDPATETDGKRDVARWTIRLDVLEVAEKHEDGV